MLLRQLQVVAWLEAEARALPHLPKDDGVLVGLAVRGVGAGEVGELGRELVAGRFDLVELRREGLDLGRDLLHLGDQGVGVAARALRLGDLVRGRVLAGPKLLDTGKQLAAAGVEVEQAVEVVGRAAAGERLPGGPGVLADAAEVERGRFPPR